MLWSGVMVMPRGWSNVADGNEEDDVIEEAEIMDSSLLPPG